MNVFYSRAKELQDELVQYRRYLHQNPEVGCNLPNTVKFVKEKLVEMGYEPKDCGECGIVAVAGGKKPGKTFMLRGDMDALPVVEDTSYSFAATNGCSHACGHDIHTASMLGAAKILKEMEDEIDGKVVFMFQPGEEVFKGALSMLNDGLLETYKPDVALGIHNFPELEPGYVGLKKGLSGASCDGFGINITGKGGHGAYPYLNIDPLQVGVQIYLGLQELISREADPKGFCSITLGEFKAGTANNIMPESCMLSGTIRTRDAGERAKLVKRFEEIVPMIAQTYRCKAEITWYSQVPVNISQDELVDDCARYMSDMPEEVTVGPGLCLPGSEDFAFVSEKVPSIYILVGSHVQGNDYACHAPQVEFDESAITVSAAVYSECAFKWLQEHK